MFCRIESERTLSIHFLHCSHLVKLCFIFCHCSGVLDQNITVSERKACISRKLVVTEGVW